MEINKNKCHKTTTATICLDKDGTKISFKGSSMNKKISSFNNEKKAYKYSVMNY